MLGGANMQCLSPNIDCPFTPTVSIFLCAHVHKLCIEHNAGILLSITSILGAVVQWRI